MSLRFSLNTIKHYIMNCRCSNIYWAQ